MANICDTTFKLVFDEITRAQEMLETLEQLDKKGTNVCLRDLARHYGIDYKKEHISVRGSYYFYELDDACHILTIVTESDWTPPVELFDAINEKLGGCASVNYRCVECGFLIFEVRDHYGLFPEECLLDCSGWPFEEKYEFGSICNAVNYWCTKMNVQRNGRTDGQMLEFIENYKYDSEDTFFYIHPFEFE